ncbi:hypothetical protein NGH54_12805 [Staphylococcus xylosus]|uniref:hypothetical protein n=1 Tax=Staphylococcus xylosus TaxID=1288 RepID=UPI002DB5DDB3|nr:hypothetical protein [Staphylococcus xylosus]MEB8071597.1 hypothetical protein [Staphylococcus xylosus]
MDINYKHNTDELIYNNGDIRTEIKNYRKEDNRICNEVEIKENELRVVEPYQVRFIEEDE